MTKGCLIFAHNGKVDYGSMAVLSASLAKKHLGVPVSLAADADTIADVKQKFTKLPFDQIIEISCPTETNTRFLTFGDNNESETVEFINGNRLSAYDVTPYDQTLLIDADYLIFSDQLNKYWNSGNDFLIAPGMLDLVEQRVEPTEYPIDPFSIDMLWATTIMFTKTDEVRELFDLVAYIKDEYYYFSQLYDFNPEQFRNDFAFSVACHILGGNGVNPMHGELPVPLLCKDTEEIVSVKADGSIIFLAKEISTDANWVTRGYQQDIHFMNKKDILKNFDRLMELAK